MSEREVAYLLLWLSFPLLCLVGCLIWFKEDK